MHTYVAYLFTMKNAEEEVQSERCMLSCLAVKMKYASFPCADNRGVIRNSTILDSIF